jgi:hypothetical protein
MKEDVMANRDDLGTSPTTGGTTTGATDWTTEDKYWRSNFASRPYASTDRGYEYYQPGYRYGFESASRYWGRQWNEVESDLRSGWDRYEHRARSTWENVKDAARDAWDRVTGGDKSRATDRGASRPTY